MNIKTIVVFAFNFILLVRGNQNKAAVHLIPNADLENAIIDDLIKEMLISYF